MSVEETLPIRLFAVRKGGINWLSIMSKVMTNGGYSVIGILCLLLAWWIGGWMIAQNPDIASFADFAPQPAFARLLELIQSGAVLKAIIPSMERIGLGLLWAVIIGVPVGVAIGLYASLRAATHIPFQFLRMISPLAWMPIAVLAFATWNAAIVFLIAIAAIWPILFSTATVKSSPTT